MNPDDVKQVWQTQSSKTRLTIDAELLLQEVKRNQRHFTSIIFWRDVREVGIGLLLVPIWIFMGVKLALPWAWHLMVPALVGIVAFMLVDRWRQRQRTASASEPLRQSVESSLTEIEHQIWLLRNVCWWYLLPPTISALAFFAQIGWYSRAGGWWTVLATTLLVATFGAVMAAIYHVNQDAVRTSLVPRQQELQKLLVSLQDETPEGNCV